ncbi:hypothetical protein ACJ72_08254, partial [Emergomyces africanus]
RRRTVNGAVGMQLMEAVMMVLAALVRVMAPEMMEDGEKKMTEEFLMKNSEEENEKKKFEEFL